MFDRNTCDLHRISTVTLHVELAKVPSNYRHYPSQFQIANYQFTGRYTTFIAIWRLPYDLPRLHIHSRVGSRGLIMLT